MKLPAKDVRQVKFLNLAPQINFLDGLVELGEISGFGAPNIDVMPAKPDWLHKAVRKVQVGQQRTKKS